MLPIKMILILARCTIKIKFYNISIILQNTKYKFGIYRYALQPSSFLPSGSPPRVRPRPRSIPHPSGHIGRSTQGHRSGVRDDQGPGGLLQQQE